MQLCKIGGFHCGDYDEYRRVALVRTDFSEEHTISNIRVKGIREPGT
jgi:hypothetical protein